MASNGDLKSTINKTKWNTVSLVSPKIIYIIS